MFNSKIIENLEVTDIVMATASGSGSGNADATGWSEGTGFNKFVVVGGAKALSNGQTVTVEIRSADDSSGTNATSVNTATVTNSSGAGLDTEAVLEVRDDDISANDYYVQARVYNNEGAKEQAAVLCRCEPIRSDSVSNPTDGTSVSS